MGRPKLPKDQKKSGIFTLRLRPEEHEEFQRYSESIGIKRNQILLKIIRELVNDEVHLTKPEAQEFQRVVAQLTAIGRNLNQLTRATNKAAMAGEPLPTKLQETQVFDSIHAQIGELKSELNRVLDHTEQRWLRSISDGD